MQDYFECFRSAREELLSRVKARDNLIKLQLFVQAVLMAMTEGVKLGGVEAKGAIPYVTFLSVPVSLIFWLLYFTEDRLVGQLGAYNRRLFRQAQEANKSGSAIDCWDGSPELLDYLRIRIVSRFFVHLIVFFVVPGLLLFRYYVNLRQWEESIDVAFVLEALGLVAILFLICSDLVYRRERIKRMRAEQAASAAREQPAASHPSAPGG